MQVRTTNLNQASLIFSPCATLLRRMASLKAERPVIKKEPAKAAAAAGAPKATTPKPAPKKAGAEQKPREPKKKGKGGKPAAKN